jgi:hypothetical protein
MKEETAMLTKMIALAAVTVLAAMLLPANVDAWGAAGAGGAYAGSRGLGYGSYGGVYRGGYGVGYRGYGGVYPGGYVGGLGYGGLYTPLYDDDGNDEPTVNPAVYSADYGYGSAAGTAGYGYGYVR